jgi:hypothetical protein
MGFRSTVYKWVLSRIIHGCITVDLQPLEHWIIHYMSFNIQASLFTTTEFLASVHEHHLTERVVYTTVIVIN